MTAILHYLFDSVYTVMHFALGINPLAHLEVGAGCCPISVEGATGRQR